MRLGCPGLAPGVYFRLLLVEFFEGLDSERGIAWRAADSLALRDFLGLALSDGAPDHSTISRTRRLIALETHDAVFVWVLQRLAAKLLSGTTLGIDGTTLEASAALRSIVRRDTGDGYLEFLTKLAKESGIGTPTRADLARIADRDVAKAHRTACRRNTVDARRTGCGLFRRYEASERFREGWVAARTRLEPFACEPSRVDEIREWILRAAANDADAVLDERAIR